MNKKLFVLNENNISPTALCCGVTSKQNAEGLLRKVEWLKARFKEGLVFRKAEEAGASGKVFIEYIPSEYAWAPIKVSNCLHINCLWVSGRFKGHGLGKQLYESCEEDALNQNKDGLTVICGKKKAPYLADPKFLEKMGFKISDTYTDYILMVKTLKGSLSPKFSDSLTNPQNVMKEGLHIFYSVQCPFTSRNIKEVQEAAEANGLPFEATLFDSIKSAQNSPVPWTTYGAFYNGKYLGHEILLGKTLMKSLSKI